MNKSFKKLLVTGASLLMLSGVGAGINNIIQPAHADMPDPEYFHSTKYRNNVFYKIIIPNKNLGHSYYVYTKMPKIMRKKGNAFALYYGKKFYKFYGHRSFYKVIHRNGQTYLPDYVYGADHNHANYYGHKGYVMFIYINKKDVGKPYKNQNQGAKHSPYLNSVTYTTPTRHHKAYKSYKKSYSWHKGMPKNIIPHNKRYALKSHGHMKVFMSKKGIFLLNDNGVATSASAGTHPHYKYLGHNTYRIKGHGEGFVIRKHGNHYSVWNFGHYIGKCYRTLY